MVFFLLVLSALFLSCNKPAKTIEEMLPPGSKMSEWQRGEPGRIYKGNQLYEYINGGAEIYLEYGFVQVITQEYFHGDESLVVDIYEMADPQAAFGIYSIHRHPQVTPLQVGDEGYQYEYQTTFWQDHFYIVIMGYKSDRATQNVLAEFAKKISKKIAGHAKPPELLSALPASGLVDHSASYIKGMLGLNMRFYITGENLLGLDGTHAEAVCGSYQSSSGEGQMLVVQYPQAEEEKAKEAEVAAVFAQKYQAMNPPASLFYEDDKGQFYSIKSGGNRLYVVFKASSQQAAVELIGLIS